MKPAVPVISALRMSGMLAYSNDPGIAGSIPGNNRASCLTQRNPYSAPQPGFPVDSLRFGGRETRALADEGAFMRVAIVGSGYVGLVSGACLADFGHEVRCIDSDAAKIEALTEGRIPIYEPGLDELVIRNVADGRLSFGTNLAAAVAAADVVFIAVGT